MKLLQINQSSRYFTIVLTASVALLAISALGGCQTTKRITSFGKPKTERPPYEVGNVYRQKLPAEFRRVALLPLVADPEMGVSGSLEAIKAAIADELLKTKKFELITMSQDDLRQWAGVGTLSSLDVWPGKLRESLKEKQIDGVILIELTALKGYPPLALGLKARLVDLPTGKTLWAIDEMFDAAAPEVASAAKRYESGMITTVGKVQSPGTIGISPTLFAKYAAYTIFKTLP